MFKPRPPSATQDCDRKKNDCLLGDCNLTVAATSRAPKRPKWNPIWISFWSFSPKKNCSPKKKSHSHLNQMESHLVQHREEYVISVHDHILFNLKRIGERLVKQEWCCQLFFPISLSYSTYNSIRQTMNVKNATYTIVTVKEVELCDTAPKLYT